MTVNESSRSARDSQQAYLFPLRDSEHLRHNELDDTGGALEPLPLQHCRLLNADARPRLDELLPTRPAHTGDPHPLRERLVHDVLQKALVARDLDGMFRKMPSEVETAKDVGAAAEKTKDVSFMC